MMYRLAGGFHLWLLFACALCFAVCASVFAQDCNNNGVPDAQDVDPLDPDGNGEVSVDCNGEGTPDECEPPLEVAKLTASDGAAFDWFAHSVSLDGNTLLIGSRQDNVAGSGSGSAYVFRLVAGVWSQETRLAPSDGASADFFGHSVALSGPVAVIGANFDDDGAASSGSAYVFRDNGGSWQQVAKLHASDSAFSDQFGSSVAVSGQTAVVGAPRNDDPTAGADSGSAYVFREIGGVWQEIAVLTASDAAFGDEFGGSVSISGDTIMVGAAYDDDLGPNSGSVYVFREIGGMWQEMTKLTMSGAPISSAFGVRVQVFGDTAIVGGGSYGIASLFRETAGDWALLTHLQVRDETIPDFFGWSVSYSSGTAIVGARGADDVGNDSGAAYVFREVGGAWRQVAKLRASDAQSGDSFGYTTSCSGDFVAIGATFDDDLGGESGSAYVFRLLGRDCDQNGVPDACDVAMGDCNGNSLPDACDIVANDCNANGIPDDCDIANCAPGDLSCADCNGNGRPDSCDLIDNDCNGNGRPDDCDIANCPLGDTSCTDCDVNGIPDGCEIAGRDCNANSILDACEWGERIAKLRASDGYVNMYFGGSAAVEGGTAIVGAPYGGPLPYTPGAGYVYRVSNGVWSETAKLLPSDATIGADFGASVAISGGTIVIGAPEDSAAGSSAGAVFVFEEIAGAWEQVARLTADDAATNDYFGSSVAISGDTIIVGAP
ncbi:MAG: FG-GAP repeat protein, partial [Phycisphaerales bacterium]|nr:FG-GAP repeat protein [Phycisphaerales bacterium]